MNITDQAAHWLATATADHRYQFGQDPKGTHTTEGGSIACGHRAVAFVARGADIGRELLTDDDVSHLAGFPDPGQAKHTGLSTHHVVRALTKMGLAYELVMDPDMDDLIHRVRNLGPVLFLCLYTSWPEWRGSVYGNARADGRPNGYARPFNQAGKNQLAGDFFGHWGVAFRARRRRIRHTTDLWLRDSNHNSASRPQRPPFDVVTRTQAEALINSFRIIGHSHLPLAVMPTKEVWNG